ncbi:MAG: MBL fold metallo-hydrolase [Sphingobacteriaceae bacterium]|nr:MBL fold metallo-hydrolase [Sphingobacteriaceae bacterium]
MKVKFIGATESVTGSKHLLITDSGKQILLDCGLYQGLGKETDPLNRSLDLEPSEIEAVILSHAHIDHSGNLPSLVKQGFTGKIYCTEATFDVCEILLMDSARIHENDIRFINKRRTKKDLEPLKPLYTEKDAERCLKHFKPIPFNSDFKLNTEVTFRFSEVGHITGAAAINIVAKENDKITRLTFTGDVGRYTDMLLKAPQPFPQADYILCESTYGDRLHESHEDSESKLLSIVLRTCIEKKGKLIIPAFSLGRTQEIVFSLDKLKNKGLLPDIKTYVDSPLSTSATDIVRKHVECFNEDLRNYIKEDPDPFGFNHLKYIQESSESPALNDSKEPCIIISASGMADARRIKHHLMHTISDEKNTVLMVGYCSPRTLGARLLSGEPVVHIYGEEYTVKAEIESIHSYSAHGDYSELIRFLSCQDKKQVKNIFLIHGEEESKISFQDKLLKEGYKAVVIPEKNSEFNLD